MCRVVPVLYQQRGISLVRQRYLLVVQRSILLENVLRVNTKFVTYVCNLCLWTICVKNCLSDQWSGNGWDKIQVKCIVLNVYGFECVWFWMYMSSVVGKGLKTCVFSCVLLIRVELLRVEKCFLRKICWEMLRNAYSEAFLLALCVFVNRGLLI